MDVSGRVHDHDDTVEVHYTGLERLECALCCRGLVFIGHHELVETGEEIEVIEAAPCRHCRPVPTSGPTSAGATT